MPERLLTAEEVASQLRATPRFVRRLVEQRRIAYVKVGRLVRFEASAVVDYVARNKVVPSDPALLRRRLREAA
jgi:excisionase family DNA binding protein